MYSEEEDKLSEDIYMMGKIVREILISIKPQKSNSQENGTHA